MNLLKTTFQTIVLVVIASTLSVSVFAKTEVTKLVTEYHVNPIGIDIEQPRLSWQLISDATNVLQIAYEIRVAETKSDLSKKGKQTWNSGRVETDKSVNIEYGGAALKPMQRYYWQVRVWDNKGSKASNWSEPAFWEMGVTSAELWTASWITMPNEKEYDGSSRPAQYYRNEFAVTKKIRSARIYATSLGLYELYLNGEKVGDQLFTPGWTSYNKRLQYQTYDVTQMLQKSNAIGAILGDGWYRGNIAFRGQHSYYGDKLALLLQLKIDYTDGTSETIVSNKNWKVSNGPILESDIYNGELYDARLEMTGWNVAGFNSNSWQNAAEINHPKDILVALQGVPVKAIEEIIPIKQLTTPKGEMVFDLGQNMVGWVRLKVKGEKGDTVRLKFAEVLDKEGNFYTANLRAAKATDTYIKKSDETEIYEPHFTFHGFRFVMLEGVKTPNLNDVTGIVIHSEMKPTGTFNCSNPLINQLQHNIQWGQKGNFLDVPTDCPQRDERLGWTGDAQAFSMTAAYNFDVSAFYTKWMKDFVADQLSNGKVQHVIPDVLKGDGGATGWADAVAIIPWTVYRIYGDKRILKENYSAITKWVGYMETRAGDDYLWTGDPHFGDWLAFATNRSDYPGATTNKDLIATAYFYYTTNLTAKIAGVIGKTADAEKYSKQAEKIKQAFIAEFITPNGRLMSNTQTAYALAISFGLLPDNLVEKAAKYFAGDVTKFKHLTTGFLGTPLLCKSLSDIGRDDLAFMLLNRKEYPSWLYPVTQGATTIWERWDGQKPDGTFQNVGMNSFNHYAYGAIGEWLYSYVAGINIDIEKPGYKHILLSPHSGGGLNNVSATFISMYGEIKSGWKIDDSGVFVYQVEVPANTTATVTLPAAFAGSLKVNSEPLNDELKSKVIQDDDNLVLEIGSGEYEFKYPYEVR